MSPPTAAAPKRIKWSNKEFDQLIEATAQALHANARLSTLQAFREAVKHLPTHRRKGVASLLNIPQRSRDRIELRVKELSKPAAAPKAAPPAVVAPATDESLPSMLQAFLTQANVLLAGPPKLEERLAELERTVGSIDFTLKQILARQLKFAKEWGIADEPEPPPPPANEAGRGADAKSGGSPAPKPPKLPVVYVIGLLEKQQTPLLQKIDRSKVEVRFKSTDNASRGRIPEAAHYVVMASKVSHVVSGRVKDAARRLNNVTVTEQHGGVDSLANAVMQWVNSRQ